jgi:hypothetical protein
VTTPIGGFSTENSVPYFELPTQNPPFGFNNSRGGIPTWGGGSPPHGNGGPLKRGSRRLGGGVGPPCKDGPLGGGGSKFPVGSIGVPFDAPQPGCSWNPWYPLWYLPLTPTTHVAPSSRKSLLYPIYFIGTNLNSHVRVFQKAMLVVRSRTLI